MPPDEPAAIPRRDAALGLDPPYWRAFPRRRPSQGPAASGARVKPSRASWRHYVPAFLPPATFLTAAREAAEAVGYEGEIVAQGDLDVIVV